MNSQLPEKAQTPKAEDMNYLVAVINKEELPWWKRETPWRIEDRLYESAF